MLSVQCFDVRCHNGSLENRIKVDFNSFTMVNLNQVTGVKVDELYELERAHRIVDFVGHLRACSGEEWLLFIQISLQNYTKHKSKLVDVFKKNSGNTTNRSWSMYTEYRNKYSISRKDSSKKVLLLYISPTETDLATLYGKVDHNISSHISQSVYMGLLTTSSPFYNEMMDFYKFIV